MKINNSHFSFRRLDWDCETTKLEVFELVLHNELSEELEKEIMNICTNVDLVYIKNDTRLRQNSKFIAEKTQAILYDTNIQLILHANKFNKNIEKSPVHNVRYILDKKIDYCYDQFIDFPESRFFQDKRLKDALNCNVYNHWISNSFNNKNKYFITAYVDTSPIGMLLYSVMDTNITIELISVSTNYRDISFGTRLLHELVNYSLSNNISEIFVGTQVSNINALNFYIKNGFRITKTTDVYHWWKVKL